MAMRRAQTEERATVWLSRSHVFFFNQPNADERSRKQPEKLMHKLLSLIFICFAIFANARQITSHEAAAIASEFLQTSSMGLKAGKPVTPRQVKAQYSSRTLEDDQPYYVFSTADNRGFVIVSGDDRGKKILGYSDTANFDIENMPPQLKVMLNQYTEQISNLSGDAPDSSWLAPSHLSSDEKGILLETANWGQGYPYNTQCPIIDGVQAPTGCVATAMAIVMKYHNWPEGYDWDSMPMQSLEEVSTPLAKLMHDTGEAVFMNYGINESGAHMNWVGHKLQQMFKYSPECQFITRQNIDDEEWISILKGTIASGNPVIYNGTGNFENHAFVIDGFNEDDFYHVNWGWNGNFNGYFALNNLNPSDISNFSETQGMVINIIPDHSEKKIF